MTYAYFTNLFLSSLELRRLLKNNIIANLNLFFHPRDLTLKSEVFDARDRELVQHYDVYA